MSIRMRFAAVLLIIALPTSGSLGALPLGSRTLSIESGGGDFLTAIVEWIASLLTPEPPSDAILKQPQKDSGAMDPNGSPGGGSSGGH